MERRRQERYKLDVPVKIKLEDDASASPVEAFCRDISSTGALINTGDAQFAAKQRVHLELTLTIDKLKELFGGSGVVSLVVDGSVVRSIDDGVVVEFGDSYSIFPVEDCEKKECVAVLPMGKEGL